MNTLTRFASLTAAAVLCAGLLVNCSRGDSGNKSVDVKAMIQQLKSADSDQRQKACIALAEAGPNAADAVPALIEGLKDSDAVNRRLAAYALGQIGPKAAAAVPALKACLGEGDRDLTPACVNALRAIDPKSVAGVKIDNVSQ